MTRWPATARRKLLRHDREVGTNAGRRWWRDPAGRPPWITPRTGPPWLLPLLFLPMTLAAPIGRGFGVAAAAAWCVFCLVVLTAVLVALPKAEVTEEESRSLRAGWPRDERTARQFRIWGRITIVAIPLIYAATWWLLGDVR